MFNTVSSIMFLMMGEALTQKSKIVNKYTMNNNQWNILAERCSWDFWVQMESSCEISTSRYELTAAGLRQMDAPQSGTIKTSYPSTAH